MCEQIGVIEVPNNSSQESVEAGKKIVLQERIQERTCEQNTGLSSVQGLKLGVCRGSQKIVLREQIV